MINKAFGSLILLLFYKSKKGYNKNTGGREISPDEKGVIHFDIEKLERLEINLFEGKPAVNLSKLPIGSTLDAKRGIFYWQPGPGFAGEYRLEFAAIGSNGVNIKKELRIRIK